jgi:signal transduction histidine kinase
MFIEDGIFNLSYSDDGLGFDIEKSKRGLGLDNIINRAQSLNSEIQFVSVEKGMKFTLKLKLVVENKQIANTDNNIITDNHG